MSDLDPVSEVSRQFAAMRRERQEAGELVRRRAAVNARSGMQREIEWLRTLVRALAELCLEKGLVTEQELKDRIARIDADDASRAKAARVAVRARRTRHR